MRAGREMMDPEAGGYDRLAALGNMLSGVAGVAGPAAIAKRIGAPAATAVMESLLGASPTAEAVADMARKYAVDEAGSLPGMGMGKAYERKGSEIAERLRGSKSVGDVLGMEPTPAGAGFTEIGSKQPRILGEHTSTGIMSDELEAPEPETFSNLIGRDLLSIVGDNTGRHIVTGVKDRQLENPVKSMAGFEYIDVPGQGYAGAQSAQSGKLNEALASEDPFLISVMMAEKSGDFARHTGNVYGEMAKFAEISSKDVEKVDEAIRNISQPIKRKVVMPDGSVKMVGETIKPFTDFPSVKDPNAIYDYINTLPTGTQRAYFLKGLDRAMFEKAGLPSVADARLAVADARQLGMDWGATGYRGFTPDLEKGLLKTTPEQSTTYDTGIDKLGKSKTLIGEGMGIPANLVFRDLAAEMRAKGTGGRLIMGSPDYKVYESSPKRAKQRVDMQLADMLDTFVEIEQRFGRDMAMRYANDLLSGDKITGEMMTSARRAYAPGFAEGGEVNTDDEYAGGGFFQEERTDLPRIYSREPTVAESVEDWWADKIRRVSGDTPFPLDERDSQRIAKRVANLLSYVPISAGMMSGAQAERDIEAGDYGSAALNAGTALLDVVPLAAATKGGASAIKAAADDVTELAAKYMSPDDIARFAADEAGSLPGMGIGLPEPRTEAEDIAREILQLRAEGRSDEVTDAMMNAADPQYMYYNTPLPMDAASREARMRASYRGDLYSGTGEDFPAFDNRAVYASTNPDLAYTYAPGDGGIIMPLAMRAKHGAPVVNAGGKNWNKLNPTMRVGGDNALPIPDDIVPRDIKSFNEFPMSTRDYEEAARRAGFSGVTFDDIVDVGGYFSKARPKIGTPEYEAHIDYLHSATKPTTVEARFYPNQVRSRFARFDPEFAHLRNLSAGVAAGAIGASQYDPDAIETTAKRVRENKFAAGGAVKYDPAAVDGIINKLREVNRG